MSWWRGDRLAPLLAVLRVGDAGVEAGLDDADGAGGGGGAAALEGGLGDLEAVAGLAEEAVAGDADAIEEEGGGVGGVEAELLLDDLAFEAGGVAVDDERGHALVARAGVGLGEDDDEVGDGAVRDPELGAVQHPVVAVALRGELAGGGVGADVGLGEGEGADLAARRRGPAASAGAAPPSRSCGSAVQTSESWTVSAAVKTDGLAPPMASQRRTYETLSMPRAAVLLGKGAAEEAGVGQRAHDVEREASRRWRARGRAGGSPLGEALRGVVGHALGVGEVHVCSGNRREWYADGLPLSGYASLASRRCSGRCHFQLTSLVATRMLGHARCYGAVSPRR